MKISLLAPLALLTTVAAADTRSLDGHAYSLDSGELLYVESHEFRHTAAGDLLADTVRYTTPDGRLLATKQVDYSRSQVLPAFHTRMLDSGYEEGLRYADESLVLFKRKETDARLRRKPLPPDACEAADAGFDPLVRRHFEELLAGNAVDFAFCAAGALRPIDFTARQVDASAPDLITIHATASVLFGLISETLELDYDARSRELIEFRGISNIKDPDGKSYRVRLSYVEDPPEQTVGRLALDPQP